MSHFANDVELELVWLLNCSANRQCRVQPRLARPLSAQNVTSTSTKLHVLPLSNPRRKQSKDIDSSARLYTRTNVRRVDCRSPVRVCGHHDHCHRFDLRGVFCKSSGQSSFRDPASLFNRSSSLAMMPRSQRVAQSARITMMTRTRLIPSVC